MHYQLEVIMPPCDHDEVQSVLEEVLARFDENNEDEKHKYTHKWYDYFVIGGRYAGSHSEADLPEAKLEEFYTWAKAEKLTVSSVVAGKQMLQLADQWDKVNAKWKELFPGRGDCTLFANSDSEDSDIQRLGDMSPELRAYRVIVVGYDYYNKLAPLFMLEQSHWNGINHQDAKWEGNVYEAVREAQEHYCIKDSPNNQITDDWLVVTVDYHS